MLRAQLRPECARGPLGQEPDSQQSCSASVTYLLLTQASEDRIWSIKEVERSVKLCDSARIHDQNSVIERDGLQTMRNRDELAVSCSREDFERLLTVTSANSVWIIFWIKASVSGSTDEVASSSNNTLHFRAKARISDTVWSTTVRGYVI